MRLRVTFTQCGTADGLYQLQAPGCAAARLCWAEDGKALEDWLSFGYIPLDAMGRGTFCYSGGRAVPPGATGILVRAVSDDLTESREEWFPLEPARRTQFMESGLRVMIMSDLHLSARPGAVCRALFRGRKADLVLLLGDQTHEGTEAQYGLLRENIDRLLPSTPVLAVAGSHDFPLQDGENRACRDFQQWLRERFERMKRGDWQPGPEGAYRVQLEQAAVFGLQVVAKRQTFLFSEGRQLDWLEEQLAQADGTGCRLVLCHAPLLRHNPRRKTGKNTPYLDRDRQLQQILDSQGSTIFVSGHTRLSVNNLQSSVEWDADRRNLYIDAGSIRRTELFEGEAIQPAVWREGNCLEITVGETQTEILARSVKTGRKYARGYYRIPMEMRR